MASNTAPVVDRIRIIPRPDDFLDRNVGSSGEVFFDKQANTLRVYSGKLAGGYSVVTENNLARNIANAKVATVNYAVSVTSAQGDDVGNKYVLNGVYKPDLNLVIGYTYVFDQTDLTNVHYPNPNGGGLNQHQLAFSTSPNGELDPGETAYEDNVRYYINDDPVTRAVYYDRFNEAITRQVQITITTDTPTTLYYWCKNHTGMGGSITVAEPGTGSGSGGANVEVSDTAPNEPTQGTIWFDSTNGRIFVYVADEDSSQWIQPTVPLPAVNTFKNINVVDGLGFSASGNNDTLNFKEGSNITIDVNTITNTLTINSSGGGAGGGSYDQSLNTTDDVTFDDLTATSLTADTINATSIQNTGIGAPTFTSASTISFNAADGINIENILLTNEVISRYDNPGDTVAISYDTGPVYYLTNLTVSTSLSISNVPETDDRANNIAVVVDQTSTPQTLQFLSINGSQVTIDWLDGTIPAGVATKKQVFSLSMLKVNGTWMAFGSSAAYG